MITLDNFMKSLMIAIEKSVTTKPDMSIGENETFSDYGLDSLDQMNMLLELEEEININVEDIDISVYETPAKLNEYINNELI